jgi:DNA-binding transcriptional regulator YiaG
MSGLIAEVREAQSLPRPSEARAIRVAAGVSQARLAAELEVHEMTVCRWEAGTRVPHGDLRLAYARLLRELEEATRSAA